MTLTATPCSPPRLEQDRIAAFFASPGFAFACAMSLYALLQAQQVVDVWTAGLFIDTDDAMRMVQTRELMAGKPWFDAIQPAMNWPEGVRIHWSHVVDLGLAAFVKLFSLALSPVSAERAARIAFPATCFALALIPLISLARRMAGPAAGLAVGVLAPLSLFVTQFSAGRVDHHGPQIALLIAMVLATLTALDPARARLAAWAGAAAALSLSISVENLPFIAAICGVFALSAAWSARGGAAAMWFGGVFALGCAAGYAVFADHDAGPVCDALSTFHVALAGAGGLGLAAIGSVAGRMGAAARWSAIMALGAVVVALAARVFPQCLADPLASLPPLMIERWLARVGEAKPLLRHSGGPAMQAGFGLPLLLGLLAALAAAALTRGLERARWAALAALAAVGLAAAMWQVRAASSGLPLALIGAGAVAAGAARLVSKRQSALFMLVPCVAMTPFIGLFWLAVLPGAKPAEAAPKPGLAQAEEGKPPMCWSPASLRGLAGLQQGMVLTSIDPGSHILAASRHRVLAGAYHRNVAGNVDAITALTGTLNEAREIVARRKIDYVAVCDDLTDMKLFAGDAPHGLAAALLAGSPPDWLEPIPIDGPWRVYRPK
jgi:hypothetical protein